MSQERKRWWRMRAAGDHAVVRRLRGTVFTLGAFVMGLTVGTTLLQAVTERGAPAPAEAAVEFRAAQAAASNRYPGELEPPIDFGGAATPKPVTNDIPTPPPDLPPFLADPRPSPTPTPASAPAATVPPATFAAPTATQPPATATPTAIPTSPANGLPENFYLPAVSRAPATDLEARLLEGINGERAAAGLGPYTLDAGLTRISRIRARQLADQGYFGHTDAFGYVMYVELLSYYGYGYAWAGENLALNNHAASESPERAVVTLMGSSTHRANILDADFDRIGVGEYTLPDGRHFYAMIFLG